MENNHSFTGSKIFGNYTSISMRTMGESRRRPNSMRQSNRKPIFDKNMYLTSVADFVVKRPLSYNDSEMHVKQVTRDDFCGCEHNLDPCSYIKELLKGLSQKDMRAEYDRVDGISVKKTKLQLQRKYFKYLPLAYPELFYSQLANIISNLGPDISFNQFVALSSIEYHCKLQHISYFLFTDLVKSLKGKKKFLNALEVNLIKHEINYSQMIQYCRLNGVPFEEFLSDYYQSAGAILIPLSQYAIFLGMLLRNGSTVKLRLILYLIVKKRESLLQLVRCYAKSIPFLRQQSRQLPWELFLSQIKDYE